MSRSRIAAVGASALIMVWISGNAGAQDADLAKQLSNPVASLISVPFQYNYDNYGDGNGSKNYVNIQPVVPFELNADWNLISRTILPVVWQDDIAAGSGYQSGIGDITQSLFFSPSQVTNGVIWGVGPVFLFPTGSDPLLSGEKWGAGPTGVVLVQNGGWTVGGLANHIWSFAGKSDRDDVNSTFLQPFISYTTQDAWTFAINTESTYNWNADVWSVPINMLVSKLVNIGKQPVQFQLGARYWATSPDGGPEGWGARFTTTFLFPAGR